MIVIIFIALIIIYLTVNVVAVAIRNHKAHKFYRTRSPDLPVLPNPSLFSGHFFSTTEPDKNYKILTDLHKQYGPTFGYYMCDQPWVSTKDLDLLKLLEVDQAQKHINRAKFGLPFEEFNNSIFQADGDDWRRIRRAISPALTNHKMRSDEVSSDIMDVLGQVEEALEHKMDLAEKETGERSILLNVHDLSQRYTLAVIFLITYKRDHMIDFYSPNDYWVDVMRAGATSIANPIVHCAMMFPFLRPLCNFLVKFHKVGQLQVRVIDYITKATDINRMAREQHTKIQKKMRKLNGTKEESFSVLKLQGNFRRRLDAFIGKKIDYDDFIGSTLFLLLAGFETTADTITCLIWLLAQQPDIQEKLRKTILEEGVDADFVNWCIMETIRWHPAVPLGTGRIVNEDITVNGTFLAKGTYVMPSTYSIHHDNSIWPEADKFKPERWADTSNNHPAAFMGFGLGPRNCVSGKLAIHEIKLVLQTLLGKYRIEKCVETSDKYEFSSPGLIYTILDIPIKVRLVTL